MADFESGDQHRLPFRSSLRGYDRGEVDARLSELGSEISSLTEERDRLAARLHAGGDRDLAAEFEAVSREVGEVLEAARVAAEGMRERAAAETARWRSETLAELEAETRQARADAEHLRGDAWTTAEELLKQSQREATHIVEEAREESLRLIGEAERQAHRIESGARRESEEALRTARMEAERLVLDAQNRHDEIVETANRQAEIASERTRALELRRDELRKELDAVRAALSAVEGELDERRAMLGLAQPEDVENDRPPDTWVPGETVRVVRPQAAGESPTQSPPPEEIDPDEARRLGEVRVISASELAKVGDHPDEAGEEREEAEPPPAPLEVDEILGTERGEGDSPPESAQADEAEPPEGAVSPAPREPASDAVSGLFARLRTPGDEATPTVEAAPGPVSEEPVVGPEHGDRDEVEAPSIAVSVGTVDPFDLRDRVVLPIANTVLREVKRALTEEQNVALEHLRVESSDWTPDVDEFAGRVREHLRSLTRDARAAGWDAVGAMTGEALEIPEMATDDPTDGVAAALAEDLSHVVAEARAHDEGARELATSVSRVFRAWRTDESERRVRDLAHASYHRGLAEAASSRELSTRWVVSGRGCATCREHAEAAEDPTLPPVHPGCGCTMVTV